MTVKGGTSPACAACKYQRRKCSSECILAPYFPANQHKAFQNAHRLFGVSNIMKILKQLNTSEQKEEAMKSIKYESDMRERYPVYGCAGIICQLRQQLRLAIEELHYVYSQLSPYREHFLNNQQLGSASHYSPHSQLQLGINNNSTPNFDAPLVFQHHYAAGSSHDYELPLMMDYFFSNDENYDDDVVHHADSNNLQLAKPLLALDPTAYTTTPAATDPYCDLMRNNNSIGNNEQSQVIANSDHAFGVQPEIKVFQDYEDTPFNAMVDDRQSYVETNEDCESSSESSFRDFPQPVEQVSKSELKNAAACFSLTSVN
ncbi:hypothetical protein ACH5RR_011136 [Cinchona calisaya]|uniref:LOB domain-containing protein n=1 Tax=Cinchona calisaya TaxID=153742 RepID=A0ABD3A7G3_9GENT